MVQKPHPSIKHEGMRYPKSFQTCLPLAWDRENTHKTALAAERPSVLLLLIPRLRTIRTQLDSEINHYRLGLVSLTNPPCSPCSCRPPRTVIELRGLCGIVRKKYL